MTLSSGSVLSFRQQDAQRTCHTGGMDGPNLPLDSLRLKMKTLLTTLECVGFSHQG